MTCHTKVAGLDVEIINILKSGCGFDKSGVRNTSGLGHIHNAVGKWRRYGRHVKPFRDSDEISNIIGRVNILFI